MREGRGSAVGGDWRKVGERGERGGGRGGEVGEGRRGRGRSLVAVGARSLGGLECVGELGVGGRLVEVARRTLVEEVRRRIVEEGSSRIAEEGRRKIGEEGRRRIERGVVRSGRRDRRDRKERGRRDEVGEQGRGVQRAVRREKARNAAS